MITTYLLVTRKNLQGPGGRRTRNVLVLTDRQTLKLVEVFSSLCKNALRYGLYIYIEGCSCSRCVARAM